MGPRTRAEWSIYSSLWTIGGCVLRTALVWKLHRRYNVDHNAVHIDKERLLIDRAYGGYRCPRLVAVLITA